MNQGESIRRFCSQRRKPLAYGSCCGCCARKSVRVTAEQCVNPRDFPAVSKEPKRPYSTKVGSGVLQRKRPRDPSERRLFCQAAVSIVRATHYLGDDRVGSPGFCASPGIGCMICGRYCFISRRQAAPQCLSLRQDRKLGQRSAAPLCRAQVATKRQRRRT